MHCPRCRADNRDGAWFCRDCGAQLSLSCPTCGVLCKAASRFCDSCGGPLLRLADAVVSVTASRGPATRAAPAEAYGPDAREGERKHVAVLLADMKSSMELLAAQYVEEARRRIDPVLDLMMEAVHCYEGTVNQVMGDGIMALFGAPVAHEDHALRACCAALRMLDSISRYGRDIQPAYT